MIRITVRHLHRLILLSALSSSAHALERDLTNALQSVGGIYGSIWIHELGHAVALDAFGATDIRIVVPREDRIFSGETLAKHPTEGYKRWQAQTIAVSGFVAANLAGEVVLRRRSLHDSPFAQSILGTSLVSNTLHVYRYYTEYVGVGGYRGNDIDGFASAGGNPHVLSAALVGDTVWSLRRMRKDGIPLFYVSLNF